MTVFGGGPLGGGQGQTRSRGWGWAGIGALGGRDPGELAGALTLSTSGSREHTARGEGSGWTGPAGTFLGLPAAGTRRHDCLLFKLPRLTWAPSLMPTTGRASPRRNSMSKGTAGPGKARWEGAPTPGRVGIAETLKARLRGSAFILWAVGSTEPFLEETCRDSR